MERRAAVNLLIEIAENTAKTGNFKLSNIVNDLARRVAMSIESNNIDLEKFCSKMAAELMFRDDYKNAGKVLKIAQDNSVPNGVLDMPEDSTPQEAVVPEEDKNQTVEENEQNPAIQTPEGQNLAERLQAAGVDVII